MLIHCDKIKAKKSLYLLIELIICTVIGIMLIAFPGWYILSSELLYHRGVKVDGTIVEAHHGKISGASAWFIVEYQDSKGNKYTGSQKTGREITNFKKGDSVKILYDPKDPKNIRSPLRSAGFSIFPFLSIIIGFFLLLRAFGLRKELSSNLC